MSSFLYKENFYGGGGENKKKIAWVRWGEVCKDKDRGGLGVKDLNSFNLSLLGKWVDRILNNEEGLWVKVIKSKYRENPFLEGSGERLLRGRVRGGGVMSGWWFEICKIYWGIKGEGMRKDFVRIVGKGNNTRFWADW